MSKPWLPTAPATHGAGRAGSQAQFRIPWKEVPLCQAGQLTALGRAERSFPGHTGLPPAPHGDLAGSFPSRGLARALADRPTAVQYNKKRAAQHLHRNILDSEREMSADIVFIVCSCQWGLNDKTQGQVPRTIDAQQIGGQDAKVVCGTV